MPVQFKIIDDERLQELAAEPPRPLFSVLDHAGAMLPWVVLLSVLPVLLAMADRPLTDEAARWGLKVLKLSAAPNAGEFVDPGSGEQTVPFAWQPPLTSWLAALVTHAVGTWTGVTMMFVTYVATAGWLLATYALACRLGDEKLGVLTVFMLAFSPDVLAAAQSASPLAGSMCLAMLAIWGFCRHVQKSQTMLSANLLVSGIALGVCLLAGGPLALVVALILVLHTISLNMPLQRPHRAAETSRNHRRNPRRMLSAWAVMMLTAFAVGGWWELMMGYSHGAPFWRAWFTGDPTHSLIVSTVGTAPASIIPREVARLMLVMSGPLVYGIWRAVREIFLAENTNRCRSLQLLVIWTVTGLVCWQLARSFNTVGAASEATWRAFTLVPLTLLAMWGLLRIINGLADARAVALVGLMTAANLIWLAPAQLPTAGLITMCVMLAAVAGLLLIASLAPGLRFGALPTPRDARPIVTMLVLLLIVAHCLFGVRGRPRTTAADRDLAVLRRSLAKITHPVARFTVIAPEPDLPVPIRLEFLSRSTWPAAEGYVFRSWDHVPNLPGVAAEGADPAAGTPIDPATPAHVYLVWKSPQIPVSAAGGRREIMRMQEYYEHDKISVLVQTAQPAMAPTSASQNTPTP